MITTQDLQGLISSEQELKGGNIHQRGENSYLHIKYSENQPVSDEDISDVINNWIGIYADNIPEASNSYESYQWFNIKGNKGEQGDIGPEGKYIIEISQISSDAKIDTYRITFSDDSYLDFDISNNKNEVAVSSIEPASNESVWIKKGKNKISYHMWEQGGINQSTGVNMDYTTRLRTHTYIDVIPNIDYFISVEDSNYCFLNIILYDANNNWVGNYLSIDNSLNGATALKVVFPSNCAKIRLVIRHSDDTSTITTDMLTAIKPMIAQSSTKMPYEEFIEEKIMVKNNAGVFEEYSDVVVSSVKPTQGKVWVKKGKNLFNKNTVAIGIYVTETNEYGYSENLSVSGFVEIKPNTQYTYKGIKQVSNSPRTCFYDKNKNFIGAITLQLGTNTITSPANAYYIRFSVRVSPYELDTFQFEESPTATTYEEYIEKGIYAKNDSGIWERYVKDKEDFTILSYLDSTYNIRVNIIVSGKIGIVTLRTTSFGTSIAKGEVSHTLATLPAYIKPILNAEKTIETTSGNKMLFRVHTNGSIQLAYAFSAVTAGNTTQIADSIPFIIV